MDPNASGSADCEYVVVGSGAGGGTLAARLAESGRTVVLLEAGGDPRRLVGGDSVDPAANRLPDDYDVPAFHAFASENDALAWNFFVRHYASDARQRQDPKYRETWDGRAGRRRALPARGDAGRLHRAQRDDLDLPARRRLGRHRRAHRRRARGARGTCAGYFQRLENCRHRPRRTAGSPGSASIPTRHGWAGWLHTERADTRPAFRDRALRQGDEASPRAGRFAEVGAADQPAAVAAPGPGRPERLAAGAAERRRRRLPAAHHARPRADGDARAGARRRPAASRPPARRAGRARDPRAVRRGRTARSASSTSRGERLYRAHRHAQRRRPASAGRSAPRARSSWPAAPSTRRSS